MKNITLQPLPHKRLIALKFTGSNFKDMFEFIQGAYAFEYHKNEGSINIKTYGENYNIYVGQYIGFKDNKYFVSSDMTYIDNTLTGDEIYVDKTIKNKENHTLKVIKIDFDDEDFSFESFCSELFYRVDRGLIRGIANDIVEYDNIGVITTYGKGKNNLIKLRNKSVLCIESDKIYKKSIEELSKHYDVSELYDKDNEID